VRALEKQIKETETSTAQRDTELEDAAHKLEMSRDKEMQLKDQLEVLETARKNASAKAAADQVGKANNDLKRTQAKAELKESQIEQEETLEASKLQRLQDEAAAAKQEVEELSIAKSSRQLLSATMNLDAQQLSLIETDAAKCAKACEGGKAHTPSVKGLKSCMTNCLEKVLNPKVVARAAAKQAVAWQQGQLDDLVMMGAMKKVRKELTTSQAGAMLSKILEHNPQDLKVHQLKALIKQEYDTFQKYVGEMPSNEQQHALAEAELTRGVLTKMAKKFATHTKAADVGQSSEDSQQSSESDEQTSQEDPETQVNQVEQAKQTEKIQNSQQERVEVETNAESEKSVEQKMAQEAASARAAQRKKERFLPKSIRMKLHKQRLLARCSNKCAAFAPCMWKCMRMDSKK